MYSYLQELMARVILRILRGWKIVLLLFAVLDWTLVHPASHALLVAQDVCCTIIILIVFIDAFLEEYEREEGGEQ